MGLYMVASKSLVKANGIQWDDEKCGWYDVSTGERSDRVLKVPDGMARAPVLGELTPGEVYQYELDEWFRVSNRPRHFVPWVEALAKMVNYQWGQSNSTASGPFQELFEGGAGSMIFSPKLSAKLAADFTKWSSSARNAGDDGFVQLYELISKCFGHAANGGAVWYQEA